MERTQDLENIFIHNDKYVAAKKADILIIANDDYEFKNTDLSKLKHLTIFDGRNILDRGNVENHGIDYFGLGT